MSWDVMIFNLRTNPPPAMNELQEGDLAPLGPAVDVRKGISTLLQGLDWSDPAWGQYIGDGFSIEFNVGEQNTIDSMMLHVRGGGDAISAIVAFARPLGWAALDLTTGEFLDLSNPSNVGWNAFQEFRDRALGISSNEMPDE